MQPFLPEAMQGPNAETPAAFRAEAFDYVADISLAANQTLITSIDIDPQTEFVWVALVVAQQTGTFSVKFSDARQWFLSNERVHSGNLTSSAATPYPIYPRLKIPANGKIVIDILDLSAAPNVIQLVARGYRLVRVA